ncbi:phosphatidate cytidylyltransferase [Dethiothermospora halolimnae]|uniref:phosphatidate cytidylyltransferase n=1 Tax=Dethiothermospora halolimnae TaxID=3114390 RepID=UPI003CCB9F9B
MLKRIISGIIGLLILIIIVTKGGTFLNIGVLLISLIGLYEINGVLSKYKNEKLFMGFNYLLALAFFLIVSIDRIELTQLILFVYFISVISMLVFRENTTVLDVASTIFSGIYVVFFIYHIAFINDSKLIWLIFIIAFGTDTFAYFIGVNFGKRKLCPNLSPKKSIEGSIAGIIGSLVLTIIFVNYFNLGNILKFSLLSIICSIMSQVGDLTASRIKRLAEVKDYGNIMPGHGGIIDRFDSILFTAPIVYYYVTYLI